MKSSTSSPGIPENPNARVSDAIGAGFGVAAKESLMSVSADGWRATRAINRVNRLERLMIVAIPYRVSPSAAVRTGRDGARRHITSPVPTAHTRTAALAGIPSVIARPENPV
jgi:hypothetical protein